MRIIRLNPNTCIITVIKPIGIPSHSQHDILSILDSCSIYSDGLEQHDFTLRYDNGCIGRCTRISQALVGGESTCVAYLPLGGSRLATLEVPSSRLRWECWELYVPCWKFEFRIHIDGLGSQEELSPREVWRVLL